MDQVTRPTKHKVDLSKFFVITCISNPVRYRRRFELYWRFEEMCKAAGVHLITVEQAFGHRHHMVTSKGNPYHLQVRTVEELWHKENMLNLGIKHALATFGDDKVEQVAWIDADCMPARPPREWFEETWHALQHYEFVQMWEQLISLDFYDNAIGVPHPSFMANYIKYGTPYPNGVVENPYGNVPKQWGSPGLAWAANVSALNAMSSGATGPLPDHHILGGADWWLSHALIDSETPLPNLGLYTKPFQDKFFQLQERCARWIKRDVGYVPGLVFDFWHGKKINRGYNTREQILISNNYNPDTDIKPDIQGLLQLETWDARQIKLRDQIRAYFRARNEDDIST